MSSYIVAHGTTVTIIQADSTSEAEWKFFTRHGVVGRVTKDLGR